MSRRSKVFIFILAVVTVSLVALIAVSANEDSKIHGIYDIVSTPISYVQGFFTKIGNSIGEKLSIIRNYDEIKAEIDETREENARLEAEIKEKAELEAENEELRALLNMKESLDSYELLGANVITKDISDWFNEFTIDVGSKDGVKNGQVVITSKGLVGIVINAGLVSSKVRCIVDSRNSLMARVSGSNELVRVVGTSNENYKLELYVDRIAQNAEIEVGSEIVTADSGDVYPSGISIGVVTEVGTKADGTTYARVTPNVNPNTILSVSVLIPEAK